MSIDFVGMHPYVQSTMRVCLLYLSRVGEILNLTARDVYSPDRVLCPGSKGGSAYLIFLPDLSNQIADLIVAFPSLRLFPVSYMQCYRGCLKAGIRFSKINGVNTRRTHVARYIFSRGVRDVVSDSTLRDLLHHRSLRSQSYYL